MSSPVAQKLLVRKGRGEVEQRRGRDRRERKGREGREAGGRRGREGKRRGGAPMTLWHGAPQCLNPALPPVYCTVIMCPRRRADRRPPRKCTLHNCRRRLHSRLLFDTHHLVSGINFLIHYSHDKYGIRKSPPAHRCTKFGRRSFSVELAARLSPRSVA